MLYSILSGLFFLKIRFEFPTWLHPCASSLNHRSGDSFFFHTPLRTVSHTVLDPSTVWRICRGTDGCRAVAEADVVPCGRTSAAADARRTGGHAPVRLRGVAGNQTNQRPARLLRSPSVMPSRASRHVHLPYGTVPTWYAPSRRARAASTEPVS